MISICPLLSGLVMVVRGDAPAIKSVKKGVSGTTRGHKQNPDWVRRIEPKEISRLSTYQR